MRIALYQPEIAPNVGAVIRITACFAAELDIIEPCGFPLKQRDIDRVAMDYGSIVSPNYHPSWSAFLTNASETQKRLILLTTKTDNSIYETEFQQNDVLIIGQESAGVPDEVRKACSVSATIPLAQTARSLNMSVAAGIALAEARRQLGYSSS